MFDSQKVMRKEKNVKKNVFSCLVSSWKNQRKLNIIKNLYILKLFNIYIIEENKWNKFEKNV